MKSLSRLAVIFPFIGLIIFGYALPVVNIAYAQSTLALQEKCAEGAKKLFLASGYKLGTWVDESKNIQSSNFECHYDKKLDKCFILVKYIVLPQKLEDDPAWYFLFLIDVYGRKEFGAFRREQRKNFNWFVRHCEVNSEKCSSEEEFRNLIRPYMEE